MVFSRLRRCFSSKSSSSTAYRPLHTPPPPLFPIVDEDFKQPEAAPPRPILIVDEDFKPPDTAPPPLIQTGDEDFKLPQPTASSSTAYRPLHTPPPPLFPIFGGDYGRPKPTPPRRIPIVDEDFKQPEAAPPRPILIVDEDFKRPEAAPPRPIPIVDEDFKRPDTAPPPLIPTGDEDFKLPEAGPQRNVTISDGDCGGGSGNEEKTSAVYRIENELRAMNEEAATHCSFGPVGADIFRWEGVVIGPAYSCYEGGIFQLSIQFPSDYPLSPPLIKFLTKIFHPNVEEDGTIHIDILKENWSSALTIEKLMLSICSILSNPDPQGSINEASRMYLNNWLNYNEIAREWTKNYAMGN